MIIDGVDVGPADYNHVRPDIQGLFPGLNNTNGAVGFRIFDTTLMDNGLHTISWAVTDNAGAIEGLGSRFFTVTNGISAVTAASTRRELAGDIEARAARDDAARRSARLGPRGAVRPVRCRRDWHHRDSQ